MSNNSLKILEVVSDYLLDNPRETFSEALFNTNILYRDETDSYVKDISGDTDEEILERIKEKTLTLGDLPY